MSAINADKRLEELGLALPPAPAPAGNYRPCLVTGKYLYLSGHLPVRIDGTLVKGRIGRELDADQGRMAAYQAGLAMLSTIKSHLGSLAGIKRVVRLSGMVNCTPEFERHPYVMNGCSELFAAVWGEDNGVGVRSAAGFSSLPENVPVEIEALFELS